MAPFNARTCIKWIFDRPQGDIEVYAATEQEAIRALADHGIKAKTLRSTDSRLSDILTKNQFDGFNLRAELKSQNEAWSELSKPVNQNMRLTQVDVVHPYTDERHTLQVDTVDHHNVTIWWGIAGRYKLDIRTNRIAACSIKARQRGTCLWVAADIDHVRAAVRLHMAGRDKKAEARQGMLAHQSTMPGFGK